MNRKKITQQQKDRREVVILFSIAVGIAVSGLIIEHFMTVLDFLFRYIGFSGTVCLMGLLMWLALVVMEYLTEKEDELG